MILRRTWSPPAPSGSPLLDRLHQDLFDALNELSSASDHEFADGYHALVCQVERAFHEEEQWMDDMDFQSLRVHREQHSRVLLALHKVNSRVMGGEIGVGREVVEELLPQWFAFHFSTMDATLARAITMRHLVHSTMSGRKRLPRTD